MKNLTIIALLAIAVSATAQPTTKPGTIEARFDKAQYPQSKAPAKRTAELCDCYEQKSCIKTPETPPCPRG